MRLSGASRLIFFSGIRPILTSIVALAVFSVGLTVRAQSPELAPPSEPAETVFLLPYFLGNGETGVYFAYSRDGLHFEWLEDREVLLPAPEWGDESLTRDPSIVFHDGIFHLVWTTSWNARSIGYARSSDLKHWSEPRRFEIWSEASGVKNTWAPELHYDEEREEFFVLFSSTTPQELGDGDGSEDPHGYDHRPYVSRTKDFETFSEPELLFEAEPQISLIDPFIARDDRGTLDSADDRWVMVIKNELSAEAGGKNLRLTFGAHMQGPFDRHLSEPIVGASTPIVGQMSEGPTLLKHQGVWHLYWDAPESPFSYCLATSTDLEHWVDRCSEMRLPTERMRHGTVLIAPVSVIEALR